MLYAAGGLAIFAALKSNPLQSLRRLKLVSCKLSSAQLGSSIGRVLGAGEVNCLLRELDIGWNDFDDSAMHNVLDGMVRNHQLLVLNVAWNVMRGSKVCDFSAARHTSCVTRHTPHVTRHTSHVTGLQHRITCPETKHDPPMPRPQTLQHEPRKRLRAPPHP